MKDRAKRDKIREREEGKAREIKRERLLHKNVSREKLVFTINMLK